MRPFGLQIIVCPTELRGEALELLYHKVPSALRDRLIVQLLLEERNTDIDLSGLWVAKKQGGRIAGAMLTQALAGKVAAVWVPEVRSMWRRTNLAAVMVKAAIADFAARGFKLVQAVIDESIGRNASRDLEKGGLLRVTELLYLERETTTPLDFANSSPAQPETIEPQAGVEGYLTGRTRAATGFNWRSFNETIETEFRRILQATYNGSLDMPELEGASLTGRYH